MHCVLQGVYKDVLENQVKKLSKTDKAVLNDIIKRLHAPKEAVSHSRKIRGVNDLQFLKANEMLNYLLYVGPVVFKDHTDATLYRHSMKLILAVRLLLESCDETELQEAEFLLDSFWHEIVDIFQNERIETINVHILQHLFNQTWKFGPLFIFSAMSFESAIRLLRSTATETHSFCSLICRRYVQKQKLLATFIEKDSLETLVKQLTGQKCCSDSNVKNSCDLLKTPGLSMAQRMHPDALFSFLELLSTEFSPIQLLTNVIYPDQIASLNLSQMEERNMGRCSFLCWMI